MLDLGDLNLSDTLFHKLLNIIQTLRATHLLIFFKNIFKVCSNSTFHVS